MIDKSNSQLSWHLADTNTANCGKVDFLSGDNETKLQCWDATIYPTNTSPIKYIPLDKWNDSGSNIVSIINTSLKPRLRIKQAHRKKKTNTQTLRHAFEFRNRRISFIRVKHSVNDTTIQFLIERKVWWEDVDGYWGELCQWLPFHNDNTHMYHLGLTMLIRYR